LGVCTFCANDSQDGLETVVDCSGATCQRDHGNGATCLAGTDCVSGKGDLTYTNNLTTGAFVVGRPY
jgi:hypothetical protein